MARALLLDAQRAGHAPIDALHGVAAALVNAGAKVEDYPLWLLASKSMQYHAGGNVGIELMAEVSRNIRGHDGVIMNAKTAARYGIAEGDRIEVRSHIGATYGKAALVQGVRPDTLVIANRTTDKAQALVRHFAGHGPLRACGDAQLAGIQRQQGGVHRVAHFAFGGRADGIARLKGGRVTATTLGALLPLAFRPGADAPGRN